MIFSIIIPILLLAVSTPSSSMSVDQDSRQVSPDVFSCDSSSPTTNAICKLALAHVNSELEAANLSVHRDGVLFSIDNDKDQKISTGHSCTVTAKARRKQLSAHFSSSTTLDLRGNSLTDPLALSLYLPVSLSGRIDIKQRFGKKVFGHCSNFGSDSYSLKGSASTNVKLVVGLSLNPSLGKHSSGDYFLLLEPSVVVLFSLDKLDIDFRSSGVSPLTAAVTFLNGFTSTVSKSLTALFKGDSVSKITDESLFFDLGVPIVLGIGGLPGALEDAVWSVLTRTGEHITRKLAAGFRRDLEDDLNTKVRKALKTDLEGKRAIIIPKEVAQLLAEGKKAVDIVKNLPADPSVGCMNDIQSFCSECRGCSECGNRAKKCVAEKSEYIKQNTPIGLIKAIPKIAKKLPTPTPSPRALPTFIQSRETCFEYTNGLCRSCRGCNECQRLSSICQKMARQTPSPSPTPIKENVKRKRCYEESSSLCTKCRGCSQCVEKYRSCEHL